MTTMSQIATATTPDGARAKEGSSQSVYATTRVNPSSQPRLRASADVSLYTPTGHQENGSRTLGGSFGGTTTGVKGTHSSAPRPVSEYLGKDVRQSPNPEALALDQYFEEIQKHDSVLDEIAAASLNKDFSEELAAIEGWFKVLSVGEKTAAVYALTQYLNRPQIRFFTNLLQGMAASDPKSNALLSPKFQEFMEARTTSQTPLHQAGTKLLRQQRAASEILAIRDVGAIEKPLGSPGIGTAFEPKLRPVSFSTKRVSAPGDIFERHLNGGSREPHSDVSSSWRRDETSAQDSLPRSPLTQSPAVGERGENMSNGQWSSVAGAGFPKGASGALGPLPSGTSNGSSAAQKWANTVAGQAHTQQVLNRRISANQGLIPQPQLSPLLYDTSSYYDENGSYLLPAMTGSTSRRASSSSQGRPASPQPTGLSGTAFSATSFSTASQVAALSGLNASMLNQQMINQSMLAMMPGLNVMSPSYLTPPTTDMPTGPNLANRQRRLSQNKGEKDEITDPRLLNGDVALWLKSIRLHKYTTNFTECTWQEMIEFEDADLEDYGVATVGARRKMLKVFSEVKEILRAEQEFGN